MRKALFLEFASISLLILLTPDFAVASTRYLFSLESADDHEFCVEGTSFENRLCRKERSPFRKLIKQVSESDDFSANLRKDMGLAFGRGFTSYFLFVRNCKTGDIAFPFLFAAKMDAVSNIIYNISYIFSIPSKLVYTFKGANFDYLSANEDGFVWSVWSMVIGFFLAIFMLFFGTLIGLICHPIATLLNLSLYLFGTLYDLFWGAMLKPLLDIFIFMFS